MVRPLSPRTRPLVLKALKYGGTLFVLALLPAAFPASGLDGHLLGSIAAWSVPLLAVAAAAYAYLRNTSISVNGGRLVSTDMLGRRSSVDVDQVEEVVARRAVLDVVVIRAGGRRFVLPRGIWNVDALERLVDELPAPVRNQGRHRHALP